MSELKYRDFRGGVISRVANVSPTTVASWGITLGYKRGEGHKRYDLIDALAAVIMVELTVKNQMMASRAADIVNKLRPYLPDIVSAYEAEKAERKKWRWVGGPYAVVSSDRDSGSPGRIVAIAEDDRALGLMCSKNELSGSLLVIPLPRLINKVTMALDIIFSDEDPFYAPEEAAEG
jgi:hypothetical protein